MTKHQNWFQSWFDTPYYHILYKQRNNTEAENFIRKLVTYLETDKNQSILDLACGKGRHSIFLNSLGYKVKGVDLSSQSILEASKYANDRLEFGIHDMRTPLDTKYDLILNLFTSFGYFDNLEDNLSALNTIKSGLSNQGIGVIDFMNSPYIIEHLVPHNTIEIDGIHFELKRSISDGVITKKITVTDKGLSHNYIERVRAFDKADFTSMFSKLNLNLIDSFGSYDLEPYNVESSKRLILIFKKNA